MIIDKIQEIRKKIEIAGFDAPLASGRPVLMGASKTHGVATLREALQGGLFLYGENRVGEAAEKWPAIKTEFPNARVELIGPLQSNKAKEAVALFDRIQSVDRESLVEALAKEMKKQGRDVPVLIQVNIGEEPQKGGVLPKDAPALIAAAREAGLQVDGLMCIPPADKAPAPYFALMNQMAKAHRLTELSMGMSGDFEEAVRFGATIVRVGSALFGERA